MIKIYILIVLSVILLTLSNCNKTDSIETRDTTVQDSKVFAVEVGIVQKSEWKEDISSYGTIKEQDKVEIFSKMPGKLIRLLVKEEQKVQNDEVIAIVERDEVGLTYKPVEVKSTVSGNVETIYLKEGAKVSDAPILSIAKQEDLKLVVSLFETDFAKVRLNYSVLITMDALPDREFTGRVSMIKPVVDTRSGKGEIEITLDKNYSEIKPGMFGRVKIINGKKSALTIVPEGLKNIEGKNVVYLVKNGKIIFAPVEIGVQTSNAIELKKGVSVGDTVVTFASEDLIENDSVKIVGGIK